MAGAISGALVAGHFQGPQFRLLGGLLWGPICGGIHLLNEWLQPKTFMEDVLISEGLLDPCIRGAQRGGRSDQGCEQ